MDAFSCEQSFDNELAMGIVLGSKDMYPKSNYEVLSTYVNTFSINVQPFLELITNFVKKRINPTVSGIPIHEAHYWGGFVNMINDDCLIAQTLPTFQLYKEISEVFYHIENNDVDFFILLDNEEYDSVLMRKLIKNERLISKMWLGRSLDFHYAPIKHVDKPFILNGYKIAYKKG